MLIEKKVTLKFEIPRNSKELNLEEELEICNFEKKQTIYFNNVIDKFYEIIQNAENYIEFENNLFLYWINLASRPQISVLLDNILRSSNIDVPEFILKDKDLLFDAEKNENNSNRLNKIENTDSNVRKNDDNILYQSIDLNGSQVDIVGGYKDLQAELSAALKDKKFKLQFESIFRMAFSYTNELNTYREYCLKLKELYIELYKLCINLNDFEFYRKIITYNIPLNKKEWQEFIPHHGLVLKFKLADDSQKDSYLEYLEEEKMYEIYSSEKYMVKPMIFNRNYSLESRKKLIPNVLNFLHKEEELFQFIDDSIFSQVVGLISRNNYIMKSLNKFREDRLIIYEELFNEIKKSNFFVSLSEKQKAQLNDVYNQLIESNLTFQFYYEKYQNIKAEIDRGEFNPTEKEAAFQLGINNFKTWKYAFFVLAFRCNDNLHFKECFKDGIALNLKDFNSVEDCYERFNRNYKVYRSRKNNK